MQLVESLADIPIRELQRVWQTRRTVRPSTFCIPKTESGPAS